jgi:hypothetical protein
MASFVVPNQPELQIGDITPADIYLVKDLRAAHEDYANEWMEWTFLTAVYEGVRQLVEIGVVKQHEREEDAAFLRRMTELFGLNYSRAVVDLVNFYLFKKEPARILPPAMSADEAWQAFMDDCNHYGDSFPDFLADQARWASVMGHVGFLVDKPNLQLGTRAEERNLGIYPYLSAYHPPSILDWQYKRDQTGRPRLVYLKLRDDDGGYRLWWQDRWQLWEEPEVDAPEEAEAVLIEEQENPLKEIPFVVMHNLRGRRWPMGVSDIHEIGRIDLSIIRELSQISEIIGFNAFPLLLAPMMEEGSETQDEVGPTAVIEFDPDHPEAKPEWMQPVAEGVIRAIWEGIEKKGREIYRIANVGGLQQVDTATVAKSGTALSAEFQQLNSKIVMKAVNVEKAENQILYFWMRWQGLDAQIPEAEIKRSRDYDVSSLSQDLADALTAKTIVRSDTFKQEVELRVAQAVLPDEDDETLAVIEGEIRSADRTPAAFGLPEGQEPGNPRPEEDEEPEE